MKAYIIINKNQPPYSHEIHVIMAKNKKEFEKLATEFLQINNNTLYNNWTIEEKNTSGVIYSDIY